MLDEAAFPRGRLPVAQDPKKKKGDDHKRSRPTAEDNALFGRKKKAKKTNGKNEGTTNVPTAPSAHALLGGGAVVHNSRSKTKKKFMESGGLVQNTSFLQPFQFNLFRPGMHVLATVRKILATENNSSIAICSLPHRWTGFLKIPNTATAHSNQERLYEGQTLSVVVRKATLERKAKGVIQRRIEVSCRPDHVNHYENAWEYGTRVRGVVTSVEDHGLLIDLGRQRRGFLSLANILLDENQYSTEEDDGDDVDDTFFVRLGVGRVVDCTVVKDTDPTSVVTLALKENPTGLTTADTPPTLSHVRPGQVVRCSVDAIVRNGLCVSFGSSSNSSSNSVGLYRGAIHLADLGGHFIPSSIASSNKLKPEDDPTMVWQSCPEFATHSQLRARVIAVDSTTKLLRLRVILPEVPELEWPKEGTVVENATVLRVEPGQGVVFGIRPETVSEETESCENGEKEDMDDGQSLYKASQMVQAIFVPMSQTLDKPGKNEDTAKQSREQRVLQKFLPGSTHTVRIVSTGQHLIDNMATGATCAEVVKATILTPNDLVPAKVCQATVLKETKNGGVVVQLGPQMRAMIPPIHLFDQYVDMSGTSLSAHRRQQLYKQKFSPGATVTCRVLTVDSTKKQRYPNMTAKPALVHTQHVISEWDTVRVGQRATGVISRIVRNGATQQRIIYVTFFGGVYGHIAVDDVDKVEAGNREVGDNVECRVVQIKGRSGKKQAEDDDDEGFNLRTIFLRFYDEDVNDEAEYEDDIDDTPAELHKILPIKSLLIRSLVRGRDTAKGGIIPGYALVRVKRKYILQGSDESEEMECKLPFDQLIDSYESIGSQDIKAEDLDDIAKELLTVGKKVNRPAIILRDPMKPHVDYRRSSGPLVVLSIRPALVNAVQQGGDRTSEDDDPSSTEKLLVPSIASSLYAGLRVIGYVAAIDEKLGSFIHFRDGMSGLVPRVQLPLYNTVTAKVRSFDTSVSPPKIFLSTGTDKDEDVEIPTINIGDIIESAKVTKLDMHRMAMSLGKSNGHKFVHARIHCSMAEPRDTNSQEAPSSDGILPKSHPFHSYEVGQTVEGLTVVSVTNRGRHLYVELTNRNSGDTKNVFVENASDLTSGQVVSGIVTSSTRTGLHVDISPGVTCFVPRLEVSSDLKKCSSLQRFVGRCVTGVVLDREAFRQRRNRVYRFNEQKSGGQDEIPILSLLTDSSSKPVLGELVVGKVNRFIPSSNAPALMLELRGGYVARCCVTELDEPDEWTNLPLGNPNRAKQSNDNKGSKEKGKDESTCDTDTEGSEESDNDTDCENAEDDSDEDENEEAEQRYVKRIYRIVQVIACVEQTAVSLCRLRYWLDSSMHIEVRRLVWRGLLFSHIWSQ